MNNSKFLIALFISINAFASGCTTVQHHYHVAEPVQGEACKEPATAPTGRGECRWFNCRWICTEDPAPGTGPVFPREAYTGRRPTPAVAVPQVYYGTPCGAPYCGVPYGQPYYRPGGVWFGVRF